MLLAMAHRLENWLQAKLEEGPLRVGQIVIEGWTIRHAADARRADLEAFTGAVAARKLALLDDEGAYRPLKSAPNLRRGWILTLSSVREVHVALDYFYPAALGIWVDWGQGSAEGTSLRETLERQTGMYRVTRNITDAGAHRVVSEVCHPGCIRRICWGLTRDVAIAGRPPEKCMPESVPSDSVPILCLEACCLVVGAAREYVKGGNAS